MRSVIREGRLGWGPDLRPYDEYETLKAAMDRLDRAVTNEAQVVGIPAIDDAFSDREIKVVLTKEDSAKIFALVKDMLAPRYDELQAKFGE